MLHEWIIRLEVVSWSLFFFSLSHPKLNGWFLVAVYFLCCSETDAWPGCLQGQFFFFGNDTCEKCAVISDCFKKLFSDMWRWMVKKWMFWRTCLYPALLKNKKKNNTRSCGTAFCCDIFYFILSAWAWVSVAKRSPKIRNSCNQAVWSSSWFQRSRV